MSGLLGVVLVGGQSRRFGSPKAQAELEGRTLRERALDALVPLAARRAVVEGAGADAAGQRTPVTDGSGVLYDLRPDGGPLAGIEAALDAARGRGAAGAVVLACDLPGVTWPVLAALVRRWHACPDPESAAVVLGGEGEEQPLAGVYGRGLLEPLSGWLDRAPEGSGRSARAWVRTLSGRVAVDAGTLARETGVPADELLLNVNRPEDLTRARALPAPPPPVVTVVGWKDAGKTTVAVGLLRALGARGLRVTAFKHGHGFRVDTPGTDSFRLRHEGGAAAVLLTGPEGHALMGDWGTAGEPALGALVRRHAGGAGLVVAEGWKDEPVPAIEVRREASDPGGARPPLWRAGRPGSERFLAVVAPGDGEAEEPPRLQPDDPGLGPKLAELVVGRLLGGGGG